MQVVSTYSVRVNSFSKLNNEPIAKAVQLKKLSGLLTVGGHCYLMLMAGEENSKSTILWKQTSADVLCGMRILLLRVGLLLLLLMLVLYAEQHRKETSRK